MRRPSPRRWSSGAMPSSPAGRTPDRKSTRLNSSHLVISYAVLLDRKSTRLNSSHLVISYAVFCLKKKKRIQKDNECRMTPTSVSPATNVHTSAVIFGYHRVTVLYL